MRGVLSIALLLASSAVRAQNITSGQISLTLSASSASSTGASTASISSSASVPSASDSISTIVASTVVPTTTAPPSSTAPATTSLPVSWQISTSVSEPPLSGSVVTITTEYVTTVYPAPTDGPLPSAPFTTPLAGSRNSTRSPKVQGAGVWADPVARAKAVVAGLTIEEKVNVSTGIGWAYGHCVGNTPAIPSIGFPGLCLEDSPLGVRFADRVTAFPAGVNAAATWDRDFIRHRGRAMGAQFRAKGANVQLGPMMNMGRDALGGRNWEGFGADPFLTGEAAYETILGIQSQGVQACAKHFIGNEQEANRTESSSNIDDRTLHEVYAHPFLRSVAANVASIMCSYNLINGTWACENDKIMNDVLKHQLGFQGYVMSDWQATHSTASAETGLDMTMPGDITFNSNSTWFGGNLTEFVANGSISIQRVDDMATRILAAYYLLEQDKDFPEVNFDAFLPLDPFNKHVDAQTADHIRIARTVAAGSTILLKNVNKALPLKKPTTLVLVGSDAGPPPNGPDGFSDRGGVSGTLAMGWGSGTAEFPWLVSPLEAIQTRGRKDHTTVSWFLDDFNLVAAGTAVIQKDVAIVFVNSDSGEDYITVDGNEGDRRNLTAWHGGDDLIKTVAANNNNTIVVVHSVGPLILEEWIDHPNVTAVLWAGLPGQESGDALADVLYGDWNPSGKLPYTIAKNASDYSGGIVTDSDPVSIKQVPYTEKLLIDYRHFDTFGIQPRFEFGFGLSYTSFAYSNLKIHPKIYGDEGAHEAAWAKGQVSDHGVGASLAVWLHRPAWEVTYTIENTGKTYGAEVSQLYLEMPPSAASPPSILRGFERTLLLPGHSSKVNITLSRYDLSVWNVVQQGWSKPQGETGVLIGASSRNFQLKGAIPA